MDAREVVERILGGAVGRGASDVHVEPTGAGYEVKERVDGVLGVVEMLSVDVGRSVVTRLMVMAQLLTYRLDVPQEGRIGWVMEGVTPTIRSTSWWGVQGEGQSVAGGLLPGAGAGVDLRLAVMPTVHGMRAVVRMPAELTMPRDLGALRLPGHVLEDLQRFAASDAGMLLITGPAGSGKTTTIYALLQYIVQTQKGLSVIALEDPVERELAGVTQVQVQPFGELTWARALRSVLRQDPQVLAVGEIRDPETAGLAVAAALSGHRLIATFHAGSPGGAMARLIDMGVEPYQVTSALHSVVSQRLVRMSDGRGGYRGRAPVAEMAVMDGELREAVLARADAGRLDAMIRARAGHVTLREAGMELARAGVTDEGEVGRVLGVKG